MVSSKKDISLTYAILLIGSFLNSYILAKLFGQILVSRFQVNLFSSSQHIPSFSLELAQSKTFDIIHTSLLIPLACLFYIIYYNLYRKNKPPLLVTAVFSLALPSLLFLEQTFVNYSGKVILGSLIGSQFLFFLLQRHRFKSRPKSTIALLNGILFGFSLLRLISTKNPSLFLNFSPLIIFPTLFYLSSSRTSFLSHPSFTLLIFTVFVKSPSLSLFLISLVPIVLIAKIYQPSAKHKQFFKNYLYPLVLIFLISYHPNFYFGDFDSVEEGFWLGWLQRLLSGQVLYKDVAVYHPPLISWALNLFCQIFGYTTYIFRLFLHLLKIIGLSIIFLFSQKLVKNKKLLFFLMLLVFSLSQTNVKNNVEFRIAIGLVPLLFLINFIDSKNKTSLSLAGFFAAMAIFASPEVGLATSLALFFTTTLFILKYKINLKTLIHPLIGFFLGLAPVLLILLLQNSLSQFITQTLYYAKAFSQGYFNLAVSRPQLLSHLYLHILDQYLNSDWSKWFLTLFSFTATAIFLIDHTIKQKVSQYHLKLLSLLLYGAVLLRSSLGRSDSYHILFVLIVALICFTSLLDKALSELHIPILVTVLIIITTFARPEINHQFLDKLILKFQTYQRLEDYNLALDFDRGKILVLDDFKGNHYKELSEYVIQNTQPDDLIFAYPWMPQLYFWTNRNNPTSFDTPYAFFLEEHQQQAITELTNHPPKFIIYNEDMNFGNLSVGSLPTLNHYITTNFQVIDQIGTSRIMIPNPK